MEIYFMILLILFSSFTLINTQTAILVGDSPTHYVPLCAALDNSTKTLPDTFSAIKFYDVIEMGSGCKMNSSVNGKAVIVELSFNSCHLSEKMVEASKYNASLVILVDNVTYALSNIYPARNGGPPLVSISRNEYDQVKNLINPLQFGVYYRNTVYSGNYAYLSKYIIFTTAVSCVMIGSFFALLNASEQMLHPDEYNLLNQNIPVWGVFIILAFSIVNILLFYFFYDVMVYVALVLFMFFGPQAWNKVLDLLLTLFPSIPDKKYNVHKTLLPVLSVRSTILYLLWLIVGIVWFIYRKTYAGINLQNFLGYGCCLYGIAIISVQRNIRWTTFALIAYFLYDIFFVYITPLFSSHNAAVPQPTLPPDVLYRVRRSNPYFSRVGGGSVMEKVALGTAGTNNELLPFLFSVPSIWPEDRICWPMGSMLGFGDVVFPGILIGFLHVFDAHHKIKFRVYFISSTIGYAIGLVFAQLASNLTGKGQPALLFLIPMILLPMVIVGAIRRELTLLWRGEEIAPVPEPAEPTDGDLVLTAIVLEDNDAGADSYRDKDGVVK